MKKVIIYLIIFALTGELFIRFDEYFSVLEENRVVKIATDIELTPEFRQIENGEFNPEENDLRVLVIGDSYIHGGGIDFHDNFSQQLKKMLQASNNQFRNVWVLDASQPSSNNLDNNLTYFQFVDEFDPHFLILGYNINDIEGGLSKDLVEITDEITDPKERATSGGEALSTVRKIYRLLYQSHFLQYTLHNIHKNLKVNGVVIPNSRFDYILKSYSKNRDNWKQSKTLLTEIIHDTSNRGIQMIVFHFPETNLLEHPELFSDAYASIETFFHQYPDVIYQNGHELFKNKNSSEYILSKYDGHPNEKAHKEVALHVFGLIQNICEKQNRPSHSLTAQILE